MNQQFSVLIKKKINKFNKTVSVEGDKSLSLRAILLASQCIGASKITNVLESEDVLNCVKALKKLGVKIIKKKNVHTVYGNGLSSFRSKKLTKIYVGNSGTTSRLLAGLLSTNPGKFYLYGDSSMNKRDMSRIIKPLEKIGCFFYPKGKTVLPLTIEGTNMPLAQKHLEKIGSAQVKSSILLAALATAGITTIKEEIISRNHTENFLKMINADIKIKKLKKGNLITLAGQKNLYSFNYLIPSDPSSAAFFMVLALITPKSKILIKNVNCNPTRTGLISILKKMNAHIKIVNTRKKHGETVGDIFVKSSKLKPINFPKKFVTSAIDEFPLLFIMTSLIKGTSKFSDIGELRNKESDRIKCMERGLNQIGIKTRSTKSSLTIFGNPDLKIKKIINVHTYNDHRIAMSFIILALLTGGPIRINNCETINTSFPNFITLIKKMGAKVEIKKK